MGIPLQEEFILALRNAGFQGVSLTCGGFLDQLVRGERYYPEWIERFELRWLYRLASEPHRLARRYLVEYQTFIIATGFAIMRYKLQPWRQDSKGSGGTAGSLPG
jgi:N-acetylglucosaminyldiphosphoundecaprenol N-acetyl-beta-D-mannosaminyltransferase